MNACHRLASLLFAPVAQPLVSEQVEPDGADPRRYGRRMANTQPSIFISYAHEDRDLAHALSQAMEAEGARVWLDQGELLIGDSLIERISEAIAEFDFVAALVSAASVQSNWCRKEIALAMSKQLRRGSRAVTVLPLRVGEVDMPPSLADVLWAELDVSDLRGCASRVVRDASRHLNQAAPSRVPSLDQAPPQAGCSSWQERTLRGEDEPVKLVGVDTERIGQPRGDGTPGSALYRVPLLLNRVPPALWSASFAEAWNRPPAWTTMHRPGIANVQGDRIVLDGTTIEELEQYHLKTLKLVIRQLNDAMVAHHEREQVRRQAELQARAAHDRQVFETVARLRFDEE